MPNHFFLRIPVVVIGMSGLRLDLGQLFLRILILAFGALTFWVPIIWLSGSPAQLALNGGIAAWLFYYGGLTLVVKTPIGRWWITRCGEENAYKGFTHLIGLGFLIQSTAQGFVVSTFGNTLNVPISPLIIQGTGVLFIIIGLTTKVWATYLTGLDTYYYKDLFVDHVIKHDSNEGYVTTGPYRYFKNPMYGVGNLQAYGAALLALSIEGLIIAAVYQATIFVFYYLIEKPFFVAAYMGGNQK